MYKIIIFLGIIYFGLATEVRAQVGNAISLSDYKSFKAAVEPLARIMAEKQIVGLGEGTHGTAEFYTLRFWISRILVEDFGFNYIAFENDLGDTWLMNSCLSGDKDLSVLMKEHMLRIWQNEETRAFLHWVRTYNKNHQKQLTIVGLDYPYLAQDILVLDSLLRNSPLASAIQKLGYAASGQDALWEGKSDDARAVKIKSKEAYILADSVEKRLSDMELSEKDMQSCRLLLMNLKQGFEPFYRIVPESARDSIMAHNAMQLLATSQDKMIIWAHNAHIAKKGIYENTVGGTGAYLLKLFPDKYYALATMTAEGGYNGTSERMPTRNNIMLPVPLEKPIAGSWEACFEKTLLPNCWLETKRFNIKREKKLLRFVGYGMDSGKSSYDPTDLISLFDAFLFIKKTRAPTVLL